MTNDHNDYIGMACCPVYRKPNTRKANFLAPRNRPWRLCLSAFTTPLTRKPEEATCNFHDVNLQDTARFTIFASSKASPRPISPQTPCKASLHSCRALSHPDAESCVSTKDRHRMWRRQAPKAPITAIVRDVDAILIRGSMAHGEQ